MLKTNKDYPKRINPIFQDFHSSCQEEPPSSVPKMSERRVQKYDKDTEDNYVSRPYTPIEVESDNLTFSILSKLERCGFMSGYLQSLNIGDVTEWKGVYSKTNFDPRQYTTIVCFCHGVALTTIYSIASGLLKNNNLDMYVRLNVCFKDKNNILLRDELVYLNGYWNFKSTIFLSHEMGEVQTRFGENIVNGRIDHHAIPSLVQGCDTNETLILLCGTRTFTSTISSILNELGFNKIQVL